MVDIYLIKDLPESDLTTVFLTEPSQNVSLSHPQTMIRELEEEMQGSSMHRYGVSPLA